MPQQIKKLDAIDAWQPQCPGRGGCKGCRNPHCNCTACHVQRSPHPMPEKVRELKRYYDEVYLPAYRAEVQAQAMARATVIEAQQRARDARARGAEDSEGPSGNNSRSRGGLRGVIGRMRSKD